MTSQTLSRQTGISKSKLKFYQNSALLPDSKLFTQRQINDFVKFIDEMYAVGIDLDKLKRYTELQNEKQKLIAAQTTLLKQTLVQLDEKRNDLKLELAHLNYLQENQSLAECELRQLES
ncbi:MerR family transcriptional regulator [Loigolactobacillus iwatensis]|uniref:hypothetical protein n=1 Tax=Loigolactobacillus iwatensis TaxID=1267156 RepID=UPI000F7D994C|nr:hypothetical protein [Loigolactobacillus iwatensis]